MSDQPNANAPIESTPGTSPEKKIESSTAHAKAALDTTTAAAKEVLTSGRKTAEAALATSKDHLSKAAKDLSDAANAKITDLKSQATARTEEYRGKAQESINQASTRAKALQSDSEQYIRDNPLQAVGVALGVGFLLGLILRR